MANVSRQLRLFSEEPDWRIRQQEVQEMIRQSKASGAVHLDQIPSYVEFVKGKRIRSLRDGSTGVVVTELAGGGVAPGTLHVRWDDERSAECNSCEVNENGEYINCLFQRNKADFVVEPSRFPIRPPKTPRKAGSKAA
jgi:hypothetical protein